MEKLTKTFKYKNVEAVIEALREGATIERTVSIFPNQYLLRNKNGKAEDIHTQTFHALQRRGLIEETKFVDNNPGGWLSMTTYYKGLSSGKSD